MSNLAETIEKFPTVKRHNCADCGNPWWFQRLADFICTMCGRWEYRSVAERSE